MFHKARAFLKNNRSIFLQLGIIVTLVVIPNLVFANETISTDMPWDSGVTKMRDALTGPLPKAGSAIAISGAGLLWMFGESQISRVAMRVALGSGIALAAPTAVTALSGVTVSGCLF